METKDWSLRHQILGIADSKSVTGCGNEYFYDEDFRLHWFGGVEAFTGLSVGAMNTLIELDFLKPDSIANGPHSAQKFLDFMKKCPMFTAIGYAVHPARRDVGIIIEGMETSADLDADAIEAFTAFSEGADELDIRWSYCRCWWD